MYIPETKIVSEVKIVLNRPIQQTHSMKISFVAYVFCIKYSSPILSQF
jgi:hypothetical protein